MLTPYSSAEIRAQIAAHKATMPDWRIAKRPDAPPHVYAAWVTWCDHKAHLETQLGMALAEEARGWKDAMGKPIDPEPWTGRGDIFDFRNMEAKKKANSEKKKEEMRRYRARKAEGKPPLPTGRPRVENPTADAIRCRENRAKKKTEAA